MKGKYIILTCTLIITIFIVAQISVRAGEYVCGGGLHVMTDIITILFFFTLLFIVFLFSSYYSIGILRCVEIILLRAPRKLRQSWENQRFSQLALLAAESGKGKCWK